MAIHCYRNKYAFDRIDWRSWIILVNGYQINKLLLYLERASKHCWWSKCGQDAGLSKTVKLSPHCTQAGRSCPLVSHCVSVRYFANFVNAKLSRSLMGQCWKVCLWSWLPTIDKCIMVKPTLQLKWPQNCIFKYRYLVSSRIEQMVTQFDIWSFRMFTQVWMLPVDGTSSFHPWLNNAGRFCEVNLWTLTFLFHWRRLAFTIPW